LWDDNHKIGHCQASIPSKVRAEYLAEYLNVRSNLRQSSPRFLLMPAGCALIYATADSQSVELLAACNEICEMAIYSKNADAKTEPNR
jgi:hypothetical protein